MKCGKYYFTFYRTSEFHTSAIGIRTSINSAPRILVQSPEVDKSSMIRIEELYASADSKYLAYEFSRNGSDAKEIKIVDLRTEKELPDHIVGSRYGDVCWLGNGFCYSSWDRKSELAALENARVYYHKLGTSQSEDRVIYKRDDAAKNKFKYSVSMDGKFLFISDFNAKTNKYNMYMVDAADSLLRLNPIFRNQE